MADDPLHVQSKNKVLEVIPRVRMGSLPYPKLLGFRLRDDDDDDDDDDDGSGGGGGGRGLATDLASRN
jgi:hypothetical protein